jgi:hypothetical protein
MVGIPLVFFGNPICDCFLDTDIIINILSTDDNNPSDFKMPIWLIVGATRGIGLEFVRQLLRRGDRVLATTREVAKASQLWSLAGSSAAAACRLIECDVMREDSIIVGDAAPALQSTSDGLFRGLWGIYSPWET